MYCLLQLCHNKYTDTKTLSKRPVVDFKYFFVITLPHATSNRMRRLLSKSPLGYWKWLVSCFWCRKQQLFNTWKNSLCFNASLPDGVLEVMQEKVFHLKHIFQCLEKQKYFISPRYFTHTSLEKQHGFNCLFCLFTFLRQSVLDVMQAKGHNTANSPTFGIMSSGNHANKSCSNIKS